jgi:opacity protein-like surface antigen
MVRALRSAIAVGLAVGATVSPLTAQKPMSTSRGGVVSASLTGAAISTTEDGTTTTENGPGFSIEGGYGFGKVMLGLEYSRSTITAAAGLGDYTLSGVGVNGRYVFRGDDKRARPYLEAALLRRTIAASVTDGVDAADVEANSFGLGLGGGVQIFASSNFAFDISGQYGFGTFKNWKANGQSFPFPGIEATSFVLRLGGRLWIPGGR